MARNKYDVDETLETKFDMKQIKRLFSYVGRYRKKLIMTIMLMLFSSALGMVIPVLMQRVMDIYIPNHDKKGILLMAALAALIILATAYILRIKIKWTSQIGQGIIHEENCLFIWRSCHFLIMTAVRMERFRCVLSTM